MNPPKKAWGQVDKDILQDLIDKGKVNITWTADLKYINQVRDKYFLSRNIINFRRNFCSYARLHELVDHLSGYRCEQRGGKVLYLLL
jgi:hypothetical protein